MKKITLIVLAAAMVMFAGCKNQNKKAETATPDLSTKEQITNELVKVDAQNLIESAKKLKMAPFASASKDGRISLTEKEKMVKPNYLLKASDANNLVTMYQKYRFGAMLAVDLVIADMYGMSTTDYRNALSKLLVDVNDEAFTNFASTPWIDLEGASQAMSDLVDAEYEAGREVFYWEAIAASLVEQIYIVTRNIDKFMPMFTDESAADVTYNFVCLHEGLKSLIETKPEMADLNTALEPLYVINAISVEQLRSQLTELKDSIAAARVAVLQ